MLTMATGIGAVIAVPFSTLTVRIANTQKLILTMGLTTITLDALTSTKTIIF